MDKLTFDKQMQEKAEDGASSPNYKLGMSTNFTCGSLTPFPGFASFNQLHNIIDSSLPHPIDTSFDQCLYRNNALQLRSATVIYLKHCCIPTIDEGEVFANGNVYNFPNFSEEEAEQQLKPSSLFGLGRLLSPWKVKQLFQNFKQFAQLHGLIAELKDNFGKCIAQQLIFLIAGILEAKIQGFRKLEQKQIQSLIPKFERFYGDEGEEAVFSGGWEIQDEISYQEVKKFASSDLQNVANQLYTNGQLKYLNLTEINVQVNSGMNILEKFTNWLQFLCSNVFLTMCGMSQSEQDLQQLSSELNFVSNKQGRLEQRVLSKRIKRQ